MIPISLMSNYNGWEQDELVYSLSAMLKAFSGLEIVLVAVSGLSVYSESHHPYAKLITLVDFVPKPF